jgi:uncharacterized protein (DUF486 family)
LALPDGREIVYFTTRARVVNAPDTPASTSLTMYTILLLILSNVFMTFAWYGHLKGHEKSPLIWVILISWGIAFFEYCFQVPANRIGFTKEGFNLAQLKTIQEVISLSVFAVFMVVYGREALKWNHMVAFALLIAAAYFMFKGKTA